MTTSRGLLLLASIIYLGVPMLATGGHLDRALAAIRNDWARFVRSSQPEDRERLEKLTEAIMQVEPVDPGKVKCVDAVDPEKERVLFGDGMARFVAAVERRAVKANEKCSWRCFERGLIGGACVALRPAGTKIIAVWALE